MRLRASLAAAGIAACLAVALTLLYQPLVLGQAPRPNPQWEYRVVLSATDHQKKTAESMTQVFSALGADGWEYVGPISESTQNGPYLVRQGVFVMFKRPK